MAIGNRQSFELRFTLFEKRRVSFFEIRSLHAQGLVKHESIEETGWSIEVDAPQALLDPLLRLEQVDGEPLVHALLAR